MSKRSIREPLIIMLLKEGKLSIKEIAEKANCTTGYVYNIRTEWLLQKAQTEKFVSKMEQINKEIESINTPKAFSDNWEPKWWQMALMVALGAAGMYVFLVLGLSL